MMFATVDRAFSADCEVGQLRNEASVWLDVRQSGGGEPYAQQRATVRAVNITLALRAIFAADFNRP